MLLCSNLNSYKNKYVTNNQIKQIVFFLMKNGDSYKIIDKGEYAN